MRNIGFNYLFYTLFFIGFCLPTNSNFYIPLPGVLLKFNELALVLLPIVNEFCTSKYSFKIRNKNLRLKCILLIITIFISELIFKKIVFNQNIGDSIKSIRLGLSMITTIYFIFRGINVDVKKLFNVFIWTMLTSYFLTFISMFVSLPIYYNLDSTEDSISGFGGRIINSNFTFGLIGLYLIFNKKGSWFNSSKIHRITYILSVLIMILSFNRTLLAASSLMLLIILYKQFNIKSILTILFCVISLISVISYLYNSNDSIKRQLDKRIINVVFENKSLSEEVIENNRDQIYEGIILKITEGNWMIGMDFKDSIFSIYNNNNLLYLAKKTDISFINVLLRYGFVPLLLYGSIIITIFKKNYFYRLVLIFYIICSLNIDLLMNQNSIFFIGLFIAFENLEKVFNMKYTK
ncbi:hypothetical protein [Empedobacter sp. GD03865]|uniref:hypothetical protein n=1 Tax=Empedobacter sp. GD03865 TaxID=2975392 RepID=UPI00244B71AA|nr:hypothetical protein [Empedobacter sp. GD03865]MDH0659105.1 hypothetical protein [Empedobacter sp. GD03865]